MVNNTKNKFIVFEGIDFSGKDTQMALLAKALGNAVTVNTISKGLLGKSIRKLLSMEKLPIDNVAMGAIFNSEMMLTTNTVYENLKNNHVIGNRWYYSTIAYNASTYEEKEEIKRMIKTSLLQPDITLYLDLDPVIALDRKTGRIDKNTEVFESEEKLKEVYRNYKSIFMNEFRYDNVIFIDANKSVNDVHEDIMNNIRRYL